jgi:hypothetical protein
MANGIYHFHLKMKSQTQGLALHRLGTPRSDKSPPIHALRRIPFHGMEPTFMHNRQDINAAITVMRPTSSFSRWEMRPQM